MNKQSIFLVGPMGAGKSTVGRILAEKLGYDFMDSDHEIEARTGVTIPVIFDIEGEAGFRARETTVIDDITQQPGLVLATGGGAVLSAENRRHLAARGFVVYLRSTLPALIQRTKNDRNRPLLQTENPETVIERLLTERGPLYEGVADLIVDTQQASVFRVVRHIQDQLVREGVVS
ncbi:shikimate kinase AroK [Thiomicrospira cyclica]|uniref:Shikimate kinase n=1 Tax=Thiomicrospira cyclica (strain DSM 14477 / JCM 11371 / ALM1) TaxID=717773 RepID=F6D922_THICA|nr:shikimate kinase AroK [Thiomicrospira cyclica]AEG30853.1 Shikimate kinase [Thiomicrospira cyclica ALM1]